MPIFLMEIWSTSCRPRDLRNGLGPVVPVVPCRALSARNWWRGNDFDLPCPAGDDLLRIDGKLTDGGSRTLAAFACGRLGPGRFPGLSSGSRGADCLPRRWSRY